MQTLKEIAIVVVAALALAGIMGNARAQERVEFDCQALAAGVASIVVFRDTGADVDRVVALFRKLNAEGGKATPAHLNAIEREIRAMWQADAEAEVVAMELFMRCKAQDGDMGRAS